MNVLDIPGIGLTTRAAVVPHVFATTYDHQTTFGHEHSDSTSCSSPLGLPLDSFASTVVNSHIADTMRLLAVVVAFAGLAAAFPKPDQDSIRRTASPFDVSLDELDNSMSTLMSFRSGPHRSKRDISTACVDGVKYVCPRVFTLRRAVFFLSPQ